jgi:hypothetical protein
MKGDISLLQRHGKHPYLVMLVGAVSGGLGLAFFLGTHKIRNDPTLLLTNKKENPYPWIHVPQSRNLKLYAVNNKFENDGIRTTYLI